MERWAPDIETIPLGLSAPMLTAGTNYWLGVQGVSGFRNVWFISRELNGQASVAFREDASQVWFTRSDDEYAGLFRVSVSVPEPNAFLGIAAIGFWGLFKRRKRK